MRSKLKLLEVVAIATMMLGLFQSAALASTNTNSSSSSINLTLPLVPPPLPANAVGCYDYKVSTGWQSVPCATPAEVASMPNWTVGGGYGVNDVHESGVQLTNVNVLVQFATFAGETDSSWGSNDWSIQANTNSFPAKNGGTAWDQFVFANYGSYLLGSGKAEVCTSQEQGGVYNKNCNIWYILGIQSLSSSYSGLVEGWTSQSGGNSYLNARYCGPSQCWAITSVNDLYGLGVSGSWTDGSGTILGYANGSTAVFTHGTGEYTTAEVVAASSFSGQQSVSYLTGEMNNLNNGNTWFTCYSAPYSCDYQTYASI